MRVLKTLPLLLALALPAFAEITDIHPSVGFTFASTRVTIRGTNLLPFGFRCGNDPAPCLPPDDCFVIVSFGDKPAQILSADHQAIVVLAPPQEDGKSVDVRVRLMGWPESVRAGAFTYRDHAMTTPADYAQFLLPLTTAEFAGQNGTRWRTEWSAANPHASDIQLVVSSCLPLVDPCFPAIADRETTTRLIAARLGGGDGAFVHVPKDVSRDLAMQLRVAEVRGNPDAYGTEIPIVPIEAFRGTIHLLDVPTDARFRATLRIYTDRETGAVARVRVFAPGNATPLMDRQVSLPNAEPISDFSQFPAFAMLDPLDAAVRAGAPKVRIEIEQPDEQGPRIWAMVSLTNNATQQITLVTPQPRRSR